MTDLIERFRRYYPENIEKARSIQKKIADKIILETFRGRCRYIGGIDSAYSNNKIISAICVYDITTGDVINSSYSIVECSFPYIPTYLSFREVPAIIEAFINLDRKPDLFLVDGHGICHPRGVGIASHIGVVLDYPTIGVAKSKLVGEFSMPGPKKGEFSTVKLYGEDVGFLYRSRENVKPIFLSPGNKVSLNDIIPIISTCINKYRLPEPIRFADRLAGEIKKELV